MTVADVEQVQEQVDPLMVKMDRWVERGVCPKGDHAIASHEDLYVVPSSGNVQCKGCRKAIRSDYRARVASGETVPVPGAFQGGRVRVVLDGTPDRVRDWAGLNPAVHAPAPVQEAPRRRRAC